jgi:hypothetical protein
MPALEQLVRTEASSDVVRFYSARSGPSRGSRGPGFGTLKRVIHTGAGGASGVVVRAVEHIPAVHQIAVATSNSRVLFYEDGASSGTRPLEPDDGSVDDDAADDDGDSAAPAYVTMRVVVRRWVPSVRSHQRLFLCLCRVVVCCAISMSPTHAAVTRDRTESETARQPFRSLLTGMGSDAREDSHAVRVVGPARLTRPSRAFCPPCPQIALSWFDGVATLFSSGIDGMIYAWDAVTMAERFSMCVDAAAGDAAIAGIGVQESIGSLHTHRTAATMMSPRLGPHATVCGCCLQATRARVCLFSPRQHPAPSLHFCFQLRVFLL